MDKEFKKASFIILVFFFLEFLAIFQGCFSAVNPSQTKLKQAQLGSSTVFPVAGNVYPDGIFTVSINIGPRTKPYVLDIDTGSDLTWLQCDAPCRGCTKPPESLYKPKNNAILCPDPICAAYHWPNKHKCKDSNEQCFYDLQYADQGSSLGVLVKDAFPLRLNNGSRFAPLLAFGCGYEQQSSELLFPSADGVLGLGVGKSSIVMQLRNHGLTQNVLGHCLSGRGGGFLFFGNDLVPSSGITWAPILPNKHYTLGPAELLFNGQSSGLKGLGVVFDSGSSYTYFNSQAYKATVYLVVKNLNGKPLKVAAEDKSLPLCWKGAKPFKSVGDVKNFFKPIALSFTKAKNALFQIPPEAYLIVTKYGNVCLGILNGSEVGLGNSNVIGDISMLNKMVIYDNERQQIGWAPTSCDILPKS